MMQFRAMIEPTAHDSIDEALASQLLDPRVGLASAIPPERRCSAPGDRSLRHANAERCLPIWEAHWRNSAIPCGSAWR